MLTTATPPLPIQNWVDLDARLQSFLHRSAGDLSILSGHAARHAVRRRLLQLYRRRRVRHALGSGTLAASMVAGGLQLRNGAHAGAAVHPTATETTDTTETGAQHDDARPGRTPPTTIGSAPAEAPTPVPTSPPPTTPTGAHSWGWDPHERVEREVADPGALYAAGEFHVYATSATHCVGGLCRDYRVPRFTSPDLAQPGQLDGDAMPDRPAWVAGDDSAVWAPAVARIGDRYVLYFAATSGRSRDGGMKCLGAATAPRPEGPFEPLPDPLRCTPGYWNIDPYPVADGNQWHLLWRQDDAANSTGKIVAAPLAANGLALLGVTPRTLMVGELPWEEGYPRGVRGIGPIENPAMVRHPSTGDWLLTWSANRWETQDYATGLAVCAGPTGPCDRVSHDTPWLRTSSDPSVTTTATLGGAGGLSFVIGPDGELNAVFHAYGGTGEAPDAPRLGWAFRVEADVDAASERRYRLVDL
jgi:Glycosyl hydrolases family 43